MSFKTFVIAMKPYKLRFLFVMLASIFVAVCALLFPLVIRYLTGSFLENETMHQLPKYAAFLLIIVGFNALCLYIQDYHGHRLGALIERDIRENIYHHIIDLPISYTLNQPLGKLMSHITHDTLTLAELFHHGPEDIIMGTLKFVGTFIIMIHIHLPLTVIVFGFMVIVVVYSVIISQRMLKTLSEEKENIAHINNHASESIRGIKTVKTFHSEQVEKDKFSFHNHTFFLSRSNTYLNEAIYDIGIQTLSFLLRIIVVVVGIMGIHNQSLDLPTLLAFLLYINVLMDPIQLLVNFLRWYQEGSAGLRRIQTVLKVLPEQDDGSIDATHISGALHFQNVSFSYDTVSILEHFTLDIPAKSYCAIIGTSGVGKTTLCSLIPRLYDIQEGEILLDGINIKDYSLNSLRRQIGFLTQDPFIFSGTIRENIMYGNHDAHEDDMIEASKKANIHDTILRLEQGYESQVGQLGSQLSGGQRQRIALARIFLKNPPILILDEPTSALDHETERVIQDSFEALCDNRTLIVIAHRLSTIEKAQRIINLDEYQLHK